MRRWMIMALITLTAAPGIALAIGFGAGVRMGYRTEVAQLDNGVFEIVSYGTSAPVSYWCGAGDFAIRGLRTKGNQRIYVWKAYGPSVSKPGKKGVQFSLTAPEGADTSESYSITVKRVGENMSAGTAQSYCFDNIMDLGFR